jgi:virginiamycin B lyase
MGARRSGFKAHTIRPVTPPILRRLGPAILLVSALRGAAQTPTPTPTPTQTATPAAVTVVAAATTIYSVPNGGSYDASNVVVANDGSVWSASGTENVIALLSADGSSIRRWPLPASTTPSSLLLDSDGTVWFTELAGFKVGHLDPATNTLTEWPDGTRRPTNLIRLQDGTFWLSETGAYLARFDPGKNVFSYFRPASTNTLSYLWMDPDGSLFTCDFSAYGILKFSPDGASATRWNLPVDLFYAPSKIVRMEDGLLWISFWGSGQLGRFDDETNELAIFDLPAGSRPYDLQPYRGRILYSEQAAGHIGVFDPSVATPRSTQTLEPVTGETTPVTFTTTPVVRTLTPTDAAPASVATSGVSGAAQPPLSLIPASAGAPIWGLAVDMRRARIYFGTNTAIGSLLPPLSNPGDVFVPTARSSPGPSSRVYRTQTVAWNRGTPDATGATQTITADERLLPSGWIAGFSPAASLPIAAKSMTNQADPIEADLTSPGSRGAFRFSTSSGAADLFVFTRTATARDDGGTYGFVSNGLTVSDTVAAGETAFVFTPPGSAAQFVHAGLVVVEASLGTVEIVSADGGTRLTYSYDWPAGFQVEGTTIWDAFGTPPIPESRIVFSVTSGKILPYGVVFDAATGDPVSLDVMALKAAATAHVFLAVARGGGPLGRSSRTDLQLFSGGTDAATVALTFRPTTTGGPAGGAVTLPSVALPPGKVLTLVDVLAASGLDGVAGSLEIASDRPVNAFARVYAAEGDGTVGFGAAPFASVPAGSRGVFLAATDNGSDVMQSDLWLANLSDAPAEVTVNATAADGTAAGSKTITLAAREVSVLAAAWLSIAGTGADIGRLDVVPADGAGPVATTLQRWDKKTLDADALTPFVIPK